MMSSCCFRKPWRTIPAPIASVRNRDGRGSPSCSIVDLWATGHAAMLSAGTHHRDVEARSAGLEHPALAQQQYGNFDITFGHVSRTSQLHPTRTVC